MLIMCDFKIFVLFTGFTSNGLYEDFYNSPSSRINRVYICSDWLLNYSICLMKDEINSEIERTMKTIF